MGSSKKHRHDEDREHHAGRERPQSTDVADLADHEDSSKAASRHQRREPTAGPSEDDRFGEGANARDAEGRIIGVSIVGGRTQIMIGLGKNQGVGVGMEGYIKADDGMLADFQIEQVKERTCYAMVDLTIDGIGDHHQVVVNPSSMPKSSAPVQDVEARIIGVSIEGGRTKIMIGRGVANGARAGMPGYVIGSGGRAVEDFVVTEQYPRHCVAFVNLTIDTLRHHGLQVMLNPSSMPGGGGSHDDERAGRGGQAEPGH